MNVSHQPGFLVGVDLGGTKTEAAILDRAGHTRARRRAATPVDYDASLRLIAELVAAVEAEAGAPGPLPIGLGAPGSLSPKTGLARNSNSSGLNGRPLDRDLEAAAGRPVRIANDADCFALSEAVDGAGAGAGIVFGAILGTGCGGGVVVEGALLQGAQGIAGEWGHSPLPWPSSDEHPGLACWCGKRGCLETWISGSGFAADHARVTGETLTGPQIETRARAGDAAAAATLARYDDRLARALATVLNLIDPHVVVLGGGMSNVAGLPERVEALLPAYVFSDVVATKVRRAAHGDSSGVRGAAWLWREGDPP